MLPLASPALMPFTTAHFVLAIDGLASVSFSKCTGLAGEVGVEEYQEGGENRFAHRFPTRASFPNLVLNQGAGPLQELWDWFYEFHVTGVVTPRDGTVVLMSTVEGALAPVRVWAFTRGLAGQAHRPRPRRPGSAVAIEAVEIAHHGLVLKKVV